MYLAGVHKSEGMQQQSLNHTNMCILPAEFSMRQSCSLCILEREKMFVVIRGVGKVEASQQSSRRL